MATRIWLGGAQSVPQVNTITPASVGIGNVFNVTINGKTVSFVATAVTVANVTAGLVAALQASTEPEFQEVAWADNTTNVLATGPADGTPFTQTSSATGGTATLTTATATAASGPHWWSTAANWTGGAVPVGADDVVIDGTSSVDIFYGLNQSAVTLTSLNIAAGFVGRIGLPARNANGYAEYRGTYLQVSATTVSIGTGSGQGSGRIKLDTGTNQTTLNVYATGSPVESGVESLLWKGTHGSNAVNIVQGTVGLAVFAGEVATADFVRAGDGSPVYRVGPLVTLNTVRHESGDGTITAGNPTVTMTGGTVTFAFNSGAGTVNLFGGRVLYLSSGTITTLNVAGEIDFSRDLRPRTVTNCNIYKGAKFWDPLGTVTFTNPRTLVACDYPDIDIALGKNRTHTVA